MVNERDAMAPADAADGADRIRANPDVRGWEVTAADGMRLGQVDGFVADARTGVVRYLVVDLAADQEGGGLDSHILVPIGYARLDEANARVRADELHASQLVDFPRYSGQPLTPGYELRVLRCCALDFRGDVEEVDGHSLFDLSRFYSPERRV